MRNCYRHLFISTLFLLLSLSLHAQNSIEEPQRWDERMINEAEVWKNLLPYYSYADKTSYWPERKQALMKIINEYPESQWVDDALLLMTDEKAVIENNIGEAILELREIQKNYPNESTIIDYWHPQLGCLIDRTWMMWAPGLIVRDENNNVIKTIPFDRDNRIDELELEAITFFEHLEKYPHRTKDVAQYIIGLMLMQKGDSEGAIHELEALLADKNLREIKTIDYEASKSPHGYLIESFPPYDRYPLMRVELSACNLLLRLYSLQNENEKLIQLSDKIANEFSFDGWYWFINEYLGDIYAQHNQTIKAHEQYQLSIEGIKKHCKNRGKRLKVLYEQGFVIKPENFVSWEDQALKAFSYDIAEIERLQKNLTSSHLVIPGKRWVFQIASGEPPFEITHDKCYEIGKDTTIGGVNYRKLLFADNCGQPQGTRGFIREEENGKVYFRYNSIHEEEEFLLYDFGMEVGDTVFTPNNEITSYFALDSTGVDDNGQKLFYVSDSHNHSEVWMEGVGAKAGLIKEVMTGESQMFTCCLVYGGLLYHNPDFENCYFEPLNVDVGNDTTFCGGYGQTDTLFLGSTFKVENGIPPYSSKWESKLEISEDLVFTAGDLINDTTSANPYIIDGTTLGLPLKFFIQVTDAENNTASDSITINFSNCACPTGYTVIQINKGDSVFLDAGETYGKYDKFYWIPDYGLSNPDSSATWCKPSSTMQYSILSVDTFGCECACATYEIRVYDPVSFFIHPDAGWSVVNTFANGNPQNPDFVEINTTLYGYQGDTIIGNKYWLKMYASNDPDFKSVLQFSGYINNDDDKILFKDKTGKTDTLYDFSLKVGDSVKYEFPFGTEYLKIEHIDSVEFAGRQFKRFSFDEPSRHPGYLNEMWLENIGSIHGPLFPAQPRIFSDEIPDSTMLSCFKLSDYLVWLNSDFSECYVSTSIVNENLTDDIKIFPNPANHEINIYLPPELQPSKIELLNLNGNTLLQFPAQNTNTCKLEIAGIPSGFYFLHIVSNRHQFVRKISIQK